ncbi:hypothetical protein ACHAXM_007832 [Skeletonema potamos]
MSSQHDWELSKENAAPLECGRSTKLLSKRAFGTSSAEMIAIEEKTKKFEKLVRRSEKAVEWMQKQTKEITGDDPTRELTKEEAQHLRERMVSELGFDPATPDRDHIDFDPMRYWVLYIKHVRESYPSDSQKQFLIMERCARTFMYRPFLNPNYQNDIRFIRTCILYADKTSNPSEVFKLMSKIKVGTLTALFWVAWAWVAEKASDFQFTEKIFQKALSVGAEPRKFLEERQKQFLRRMSRHWLNASQANEDDVEGGDGEDERGALNSISSAGMAANNRGAGFNRNSSRDRHLQAQQSRQLSSIDENNSAGFCIFQDNDENAEDVLRDEDDGAQRSRQLAKESERIKENRMRPESWNERGYGLKNPSLATEAPLGSDSIVGTARGSGSAGYGGRQTSSSFAAAAFEVFVDDECCDDDNNLSSKKVDNRSLRHRLDGGTAERLTRDPLRYMKNPSKMESDHRKYEPKSDYRHDIRERGEEAKLSYNIQENQIAETTKSVSGGGYSKELLKADSSGQECCFEERRLERRYYKLLSFEENFNLLKQDSYEDEKETSQMDVETSLEDEDMEECTAEFDEHLVKLMEKPKSMLKSSLRIGMKTRTLETPSTGTRKVLFGANTNVEYNNKDESLNTTSGSSQLNGSFVRAEETINTKLANAEISMMFCSPNANVSRVESPGKPLFSSSHNNFHDDVTDTSNLASFAIHDENKQGAGGGFSIFQDDADSDTKSNVPRYDPEDTASHSLLGDVLTGLDSSPKHSKPAAPSRKMVPNMKHLTLPSKSGSVLGVKQNETRRDSGGDTASLSVIGDVLDSIESCNVDDSPKKALAAGFSIFSDENAYSLKNSKPKSSEGGLSFAIFSDELEESATKKLKIRNDSENSHPQFRDEPSFGDISRIDDALDNERTRTNNLQMSDEYSKLKSKGSLLSAIDYTMEHRKNTETALRSCMKAAIKSHSGFRIFDQRGTPLPKALLRKAFTSGTHVDFVGGKSATIINELGRGVYGVVLLVDVSSEEFEEGRQRRALKIQAPIGSLAHEYALLLEVEKRVQPDSSGFYPFPRSEALYAFSQGGLFMMTAGSDSGMNLIDVANTYKKIMGNVPELIAVYYTSRMLRHLELLHEDGKVLHCDVKPDNWVLTTSKARNAVGGFDLMLVDFGRAIDLEKVTRQGEDPLQTLFKGSIAAEDMECGTMREGQPWGVDLDYFGLCASAFILLFGSHMEVVKDKNTGNWRLNKMLRRYWQKDLWQSLFHSLLNFELSPERKCLRDLRVAFDGYIDENDRSREIAIHLNQLFTHLPKKR